MYSIVILSWPLDYFSICFSKMSAFSVLVSGPYRDGLYMGHDLLILDPMFRFKRVWLALRLKERVQSGQVDLKKGSKRVQFYNVNLNLLWPVLGWGWALRVQNLVELGRVCPQSQNSGQILVGLVEFIWPHYLLLTCTYKYKVVRINVTPPILSFWFSRFAPAFKLQLLGSAWLQNMCV